MKKDNPDLLKIGIAQISPVWLDRNKTISKVIDYVEQASSRQCDLVVFSEALVPGYPHWVEKTDGARFNSKVQKEIYSHYQKESVCIEEGHLIELCVAAREKGIDIISGIIERPADRGYHSLYCSLVYINNKGDILNVHRKLMPTYEERLVWSPGDGNGLNVFPMGSFRMGALNCWENWMPLPRASLYAQGEDLHIAIWPGNVHNTQDITRFIARESRSYVISASSFMQKQDISENTPHCEQIRSNTDDILSNGGSCVAGPDGEWIIEPVANEETLLTVDIDHARVREERQNFDPSGHYSRPDVTKLEVNKERQGILKIKP